MPPFGEAVVRCEVTLYDPGPFSCPMSLNYYDGGAFFGVRLRASGTAVAKPR